MMGPLVGVSVTLALDMFVQYVMCGGCGMGVVECEGGDSRWRGEMGLALDLADFGISTFRIESRKCMPKAGPDFWSSCTYRRSGRIACNLRAL